MAKCANCGSELFFDSRFCPSCGANVLSDVSIGGNEEPADDNIDLSEGTSDILTDNSAASAFGELPQNFGDEADTSEGSMYPEDKARLLDASAEAASDVMPAKNDEIPFSSVSDNSSGGAVTADISYDRAQKKEEPVKTKHITVQPEDEIPISWETKKPDNKGGKIAAFVLAMLGLAAVAAAVTILLTTNAQDKSADEIAETTVYKETTSVTEVTESETEVQTETTEKTAEETYDSSGVQGTPAGEENGIMTDKDGNFPLYSASFEPAHSSAMGREISCTLDLTEGTSFPDGYYKNMIVTAYFEVTDENAPKDRGDPMVVMLVYIDDKPIDVTAHENSSEGYARFDSGDIIAACKEAGTEPENIAKIAFRSNGIPVDVYSVTAEVFE